MEGFQDLAGTIAICLGIVNTAALVIERWRRPSAAKIEKLVCDVDKLDGEISTIKTEMKHLPTAQAVHDLVVQMTSLTGQLRVVETEIQGAARAVRRVEDHFLAGGK